MLRSRDARLIVGAVGISSLGDFLLCVAALVPALDSTAAVLALAAVLGGGGCQAIAGAIPVATAIAGLLIYRSRSRERSVATAAPSYSSSSPR